MRPSFLVCQGWAYDLLYSGSFWNDSGCGEEDHIPELEYRTRLPKRWNRSKLEIRYGLLDRESIIIKKFRVYCNLLKLTITWKKQNKRWTCRLWSKAGITMEYNQILAKRIQELCRLKHISVEILGKKAKINERTLTRIVEGMYKNPGMATIFRIACALDRKSVV